MDVETTIYRVSHYFTSINRQSFEDFISRCARNKNYNSVAFKMLVTTHIPQGTALNTPGRRLTDAQH